MSDKTIGLTNAELEITQKLQMHFPRGILSPEEIKRWSGYLKEILNAKLTRMLKEKDCLPIGRPFMTVKLGVYSSIEEIRQAILSDGKKIEMYAERILDKVVISSRKTGLYLYEVMVGELGFTSSACWEDIHNQALRYKFDKCPRDAGPLAFKKCHDGKRRIIGMDSVNIQSSLHSGVDLGVLRLGSDGGVPCLFYCNASRLWDLDEVFVLTGPPFED